MPVASRGFEPDLFTENKMTDRSLPEQKGR
jgi:hypothetical protein